jgi:uncharacterized protein YfkK (UPF0435 family)
MATEASHVTTRAELAVKRVEKILEKVNMTNRTLPQGMQPFQLPLPQMEASASVDALITTLVAAGVLDEQDFVDAKYERLADLAEGAYEQVQKAKRDALGLVIAGR